MNHGTLYKLIYYQELKFQNLELLAVDHDCVDRS